MADSNFQDAVVLNADTLQFNGEQFVVGTGVGNKSIVLSNSAAALFLAGSAAVNHTLNFPDANGTIGIVTAFAANGSTLSNGLMLFAPANNVSFGFNGSTLTASISQTVQPGVFAIGVSTGGNTLGNTATTIGTYVLAGLGGITLSQSTAAGSLATLNISMTQSTGPGGIAAGGSTATSGTVVFSNSNGISFSLNGQTVTASMDAVRSVIAGAATATGPNVSFANSNGVSFGVNGQTITASVVAAAAQKITMFSQWAEFDTNFSISNATMSIQKVSVPLGVSATQAAMLLALSGNTNSSGALTISMGVYTLAGTVASLSTSGSRQISWTSGALTTASSQYGGVSGTRYRTIPVNMNLSAGEYLFAFHMQTSNDGTWRAFGRQAASIVGGFDGFESSYFLDGSSISSFVSAFPASIVATNTNYARTGAGAQRQPGVIMVGTF